MIAYYELTKNIYDHLLSDEDINTVVIGAADLIDTKKQSLFPLAHILIGTATPRGGTIEFNVTVSTMDIIDIKKEDQDFSWKGHDNKQNILNTMFAVLENLEKSLDRGALQELGWEIVGDAVATPFEDQFENLLTGWSMPFNVSIPNTVQNCAAVIPNNAVKFISANNEYISSPAQNYVGNDINGLHIEIKYENLESVLNDDDGMFYDRAYFVTQGNLGVTPIADNLTVYLYQNPTEPLKLHYRIGENAAIIDLDGQFNDPVKGSIIIISDGITINVIYNQTLVSNEPVTNADISNVVSTNPLFFGAIESFGNPTPATQGIISYTKINDHVWTFSEGTGETTINSEGVISTLNSDVSVNNMWVAV